MIGVSRLSFDVDSKKLLYNTGQMLKDKRLSMNLSLSDVSLVVGMSLNYLSEIERGLKKPSDNLIEKISDYYGIDIDYLFCAFDKIPKIVRGKVNEKMFLTKAIREIEERKDLREDRKQFIYDELYSALQELLQELDGEKNK